MVYRYIIISFITDGKSALSVSASHFNKVASDAYKGISDEYKQHLKESSSPRIQQMSRKSIMKCGEKAFKKNSEGGKICIMYYRYNIHMYLHTNLNF